MTSLEWTMTTLIQTVTLLEWTMTLLEWTMTSIIISETSGVVLMISNMQIIAGQAIGNKTNNDRSMYIPIAVHFLLLTSQSDFPYGILKYMILLKCQ